METIAMTAIIRIAVVVAAKATISTSDPPTCGGTETFLHDNMTANPPSVPDEVKMTSCYLKSDGLAFLSWLEILTRHI